MKAAVFLAKLGDRINSVIVGLLMLGMLLYGGIFPMGYGDALPGRLYLQ